MRKIFEKALQENVYDEATHRAFADWLYEEGFDEEAEYHVLWTAKWQKSKEWLEEFASRCGGTSLDYNYENQKEITLEDVVQAGYDWKNTVEIHEYIEEEGQKRSYLDGDRFIQVGSTDAQGQYTKEFWEHWQIYTRTNIDENKKGNPFSCSC